MQLLRTLVVLTQSLEPLPNETMMTMKLFYYDDGLLPSKLFKYVLFHELLSLLLRNLVTPEDYEPPGFKAASSDNFSFEHEPMNIKVGDVSTVGSLLYDVLVFNYSPDITYDISLLYE